MQWVSNLTKALDNDRFRLFHQEISSVDNKPGKEKHYEILIRMLDDNDRIIAPGAFVPAAERFNLMPAIDRWVISKLFSNIQNLQSDAQRRSRTVYSINISGNSMNDPLLLDFIRELTRTTEVIPEYICFEITETAAIGNLSNAVNFINQLKSEGFLFSLDDFGSGLSSFTYLKNLPVDYLKIDGSFVRGIADDLIDRAMVEAINKIGQVMGLQTIAEFVENEFILQNLSDLGVDWAQGYAIHKPSLLRGIQYH
jgi:EAL domain-containing protein (putative c-di-GMP-specific phosphodiesterase class I)